MSHNRRDSKTDTNQAEIVKALRQIGCFVLPTHQLKDAFDILVCYRGKTFIIEIKNPDYLPKEYDRERLEKALSDGEKKCMEQIQRTGVQYHIIATVDEAIKLVTNGEK
jgi:hypothetical protein